MTKQITKEAVELAIKHSPEILLGCGIVGVLTLNDTSEKSEDTTD